MGMKVSGHGWAAEAARAKEERYRLLVEHLPVGIYRTTPDGHFIEANPSLARMLGVRNPTALLRYNVKDFYVKKKDREEHLQKLATRPRFFTEFELRLASGRRIWVRDYCQAHENAGVYGHVVHTLLRLLFNHLEHQACGEVLDTTHAGQRLVDRHGADRNRRIADNGFADARDVAEIGRAHV
jgi:PAS domain S-box-containing protein